MVPKDLLSAHHSGLGPVFSHLNTASELDKIEVENNDIPLTPANQSLKELLSRCINQVRISDTEKVIAEEEANRVKHLLKPAKADHRQHPGRLFLSSKLLAKLYRKCEEQDKKKPAAAEKHQVKRSAWMNRTPASSKKRKVLQRQSELDLGSDRNDSNTVRSTGIDEVSDKEVIAEVYYT